MEAAVFEKILVPTDFSANADAALRYAEAIADRFGGSLHLLHVLEEPVLPGPLGTEVFLPDSQAIHEELQRDAERKLAERLPTPLRARLRGTTDIVVGPIASSIVDHARTHQIDLIVVGTHSRTGVAHMLLGSVAESVVRKASCPVLTVDGSR